MRNEQMKKMMSGAAILSAGAIGVKTLSAIYRILFQNFTGNEGFYVFQQVYPFYGLAVSLSLNGLPVFLSKITAEKDTRNEQFQVLLRFLMILSVICTLLFLFIFSGAGQLAQWMGDAQLTPLIRVAAWMFLFVPFLSVARGYFQGILYMTPTAVSQFTEQVVRVIVILLAAGQFYLYGGSLYQMGTRALHSSWMSAAAASLVLLFFAWKRRNGQLETLTLEPINPPAYKTLLKRIATEGLSVSLIASLLIILQFIDSFTIYKQLVASGYSVLEAMNRKGIYDRGQLLVQMAMVVSIGLASGLLPVLRMQERKGKQQAFLRTARSVLRITTVVASAASVGMIVIMPRMNPALFEESTGNEVLQVFVLSVLVFSLITAYNAILQSLDKHFLILLGIGIAGGTKLVGNLLLLPMLGTLGASISTVGSMAVMYISLRILSPVHLKALTLERNFITKLLLALTGMALAARIVLEVFGQLLPPDSRTLSIVLVLIAAGAGAGVFGYLLIRLKVLTIREWLSIPFGKRLLRGRRK